VVSRVWWREELREEEEEEEAMEESCCWPGREGVTTLVSQWRRGAKGKGKRAEKMRRLM